jgi:hypothetical protein
VAEAGFADVRVVAIEGPAWTIVDALGDDADARFESPPRCAQLTENFAQIKTQALIWWPSHQLSSIGRRREGSVPVPHVPASVPVV